MVFTSYLNVNCMNEPRLVVKLVSQQKKVLVAHVHVACKTPKNRARCVRCVQVRPLAPGRADRR